MGGGVSRTGPLSSTHSWLRRPELSGPISRDIAIVSLRYPLSRDTFSAIAAIPQQGAIPPPLVPSFTQTYQCDTPFCNISRDTCAIPQENKHEKYLRYYRWKYRAIWKVSLLGLLGPEGLGRPDLFETFWGFRAQRASGLLYMAGVHLWKPFLGTYSWLFQPISGWEVVVQATINH